MRLNRHPPGAGVGPNARAAARWGAALWLALGAGGAAAWSNHALLSYRALEVLPEVAAAPAVPVEPLEAFLRDQEVALATELEAQERWARAHRPGHAARPEALAFRAVPAATDAQRRAAFLAALRLSSTSRFALFVQIDPRRPPSGTGAELPFDAVSAVAPGKGATQRWVALRSGDRVPALDVVASATDEPDYGLDLNLFDDNARPADQAAYGFGKQPFGNAAVVIGSQAPFHMGFFHQGSVFNTLAPSFARTFTELRVQQFSGLSALAFRTGHPYWGWRFAGLALHYVQDLTQPYHASAAPGESLARMMWVNLLDKLGMPGGRQALVVLQGNRHFALEQVQAQSVFDSAHAGRDGELERALHDRSADATYPAWSLDYPRAVVAAEAYDAGRATDAAVVAGVPARYVNDPDYDFAASDAQAELVADMAKQPASQRASLQQAIATLMRHLGAHTRNATKGILQAPAP